MADKKISDLTSASGVNYTDYLPIVQTGSTKKILMSLFGLRWNSATSKWDANSAKLAGLANGLASDEAVTVAQILSSSSKSADYTVTDTDGITTIYVTTGASNRTITLPTLSDNQDRFMRVKKIDSGAGAVILDGEGAETVDGQANKKLIFQYDSMTIKGAPTEWSMVDRYDAPVHFRAYGTGGTGSNPHIVILPSVTDDSHSSYNVSTGAITIKKDGYYKFGIALNTNQGSCAIYLNTSASTDATKVLVWSASSGLFSGSQVFKLTAGTYYIVLGGTGVSWSAGNTFTMQFMGAS